MPTSISQEDVIIVLPAFDGFFREPEGGFQATLVDPHRFHHVPLAGLPEPLQFFRSTAIASENRSSLHLVLLGLQLSDDAMFASARAVRDAFPETVVTFVRDARTGYARATCCHPVAGELASAAASSVAAMLAGGSWDESDPIVIDLDSARFDVSLELRQTGGWTARIKRSPKAR
jgi:hypothetical protein